MVTVDLLESKRNNTKRCCSKTAAQHVPTPHPNGLLGTVAGGGGGKWINGLPIQGFITCLHSHGRTTDNQGNGRWPHVGLHPDHRELDCRGHPTVPQSDRATRVLASGCFQEVAGQQTAGFSKSASARRELCSAPETPWKTTEVIVQKLSQVG